MTGATHSYRRRPWNLLILLPLLCLLTGSSSVAREPQSDQFAVERMRMVDEQIRARGVEEGRVLEAMELVPRHLFVPESIQNQAYRDFPQRIGSGQTISQPYIVALMTSLLKLKGKEKVLEIGTGSGYQAAVLAKVAGEVYTIEIISELAEQARKTLGELKIENVHVKIGDGYEGWPEEAPFDAIIVTAAPPEIPEALVDQLKVGGRLVVPVGKYFQNLMVVRKTVDGVKKRRVAGVRFVPMVSHPIDE